MLTYTIPEFSVYSRFVREIIILVGIEMKGGKPYIM